MMEASLRAIMDCGIPVCREHMTSMLRAITRANRRWEQLMVTVIRWRVESVHWLRGF